MFGNTFNDPRKQAMLSAGLQDMLLGLNNRQMTKVDALKKEERTRDFRALQLEEMRGKIAKDKREESQYNEGRKMFTELVAQNGGVVDAGVVQQLALQFPTLAKQVSSIVPKPGSATNIQKLHEYQATLPPGSPQYMQVQNAIDKTTTHAPPLVNLNQSQAEGTGRVMRAGGASQEVDALKQQGIETLNGWDTAVATVAPEAIKPMLMTPKGKAFSQAKNNWIENFGRTESGGVIGPNEYKSWEGIYFGQYGDDPEDCCQP